MLHTYRYRLDRAPYGVQRFHNLRPSAIRYPRPQLSHGHMMMGRPAFYPTPHADERTGFFGGLLSTLATIFCLKRSQQKRRGFGGGDPGTFGGGSCGGGGGCGGGGD